MVECNDNIATEQYIMLIVIDLSYLFVNTAYTFGMVS